jgi:hypothetical protein
LTHVAALIAQIELEFGRIERYHAASR